jgi:hypothetical protein
MDFWKFNQKRKLNKGKTLEQPWAAFWPKVAWCWPGYNLSGLARGRMALSARAGGTLARTLGAVAVSTAGAVARLPAVRQWPRGLESGRNRITDARGGCQAIPH